jgi:hypothetical protein
MLSMRRFGCTSGTFLKLSGTIMSANWQPKGGAMRRTIVALVFLVIAGGAHAQGMLPLQRLAGQWSGTGTINLAGGASEPIRCRASYDVLEQQNNLHLAIRCASESYKFDLLASADVKGEAISGTWSETTRNAAGNISGKARGNRFEVEATGPSFNATLTLVTRGDRQKVEIKSRDAQTSVRGASIDLKRS